MKTTLCLFLLLIALAPAHAQTTEKRICVDNPYREWNAPIRQAVREFNRVVPTVIAAEGCDIVIYVVPELPCPELGFAAGCTAGNQVYLLANYSQRITVTLHELMHVFGYWDHAPLDVPSVTNQGFQFYKRLTEFDIAMLQSMYPQ